MSCLPYLKLSCYIFTPAGIIYSNGYGDDFLSCVALVMGMILFFFLVSLSRTWGFGRRMYGPRGSFRLFSPSFYRGFISVGYSVRSPLSHSQKPPFFYFIYFPLKVYLGQLTPIEILQGFRLGSCGPPDYGGWQSSFGTGDCAPTPRREITMKRLNLYIRIW